MSQPHVIVLSGGISHEREVSLRSGRRVADALESAGIRVTLADTDAELLHTLISQRPDVVFPAVHGASGEDGALLSLLEALKLPYVGSPAAAALIAWSKPIARHLVEQSGIAVPSGVVLSREAFRELSAAAVLDVLTSTQSFPLVVKPGQGGSAQGVTIVSEADALPRAMVDAFTYADTAVCEQKIDGVEVAVSVVETNDGVQALPAVEIEPLNGVYGYEARYNAGETRFFAPARLSDEVSRRVAETGVQVHQVLGLRDLSRVDLIVDRDGTPWFLEANAIPGMTETSLLPLALDAAKLNHGEFYANLVRRALNR